MTVHEQGQAHPDLRAVEGALRQADIPENAEAVKGAGLSLHG